jgi:hypothetical protein
VDPNTHARLVHVIDQALPVLKAHAPMLHGYFDSLVAAGFTRHEAMELTKQFHWTLLVETHRGLGLDPPEEGP